MKTLLIATLCCLSTQSMAVNLIIQDPCGSTPWLNTHLVFDAKKSVGELTIDGLNQTQIPYVGNPAGINSIRETVIGNDALEILSDNEMRAYGWCYSINGTTPEALADQVYPSSGEDRIEWFFAYAHYVNGTWREYCQPTSLTKPKFICTKNN